MDEFKKNAQESMQEDKHALELKIGTEADSGASHLPAVNPKPVEKIPTQRSGQKKNWTPPRNWKQLIEALVKASKAAVLVNASFCLLGLVANPVFFENIFFLIWLPLVAILCGLAALSNDQLVFGKWKALPFTALALPLSLISPTVLLLSMGLWAGQVSPQNLADISLFWLIPSIGFSTVPILSLYFRRRLSIHTMMTCTAYFVFAAIRLTMPLAKASVFAVDSGVDLVGIIALFLVAEDCQRISRVLKKKFDHIA